jgi:hypothetical protein
MRGSAAGGDGGAAFATSGMRQSRAQGAILLRQVRDIHPDPYGVRPDTSFLLVAAKNLGAASRILHAHQLLAEILSSNRLLSAAGSWSKPST